MPITFAHAQTTSTSLTPTATKAFADDVVDATLMLSCDAGVRVKQLGALQTRIEAFLQHSSTEHDAVQTACALLSAMFETPVYPADVLDTSRLQAHLPDLEAVVVIIARSARQRPRGGTDRLGVAEPPAHAWLPEPSSRSASRGASPKAGAQSPAARSHLRPPALPRQASQIATGKAQLEATAASASSTSSLQQSFSRQSRLPQPPPQALLAALEDLLAPSPAASNASACSDSDWSEGSGDELDDAAGQVGSSNTCLQALDMQLSDAAFAQALHTQETQDFDLAVQWQRQEDDAYRSGGRVHHSVARLAQQLGRDKVPAALINPATRALFVDPCFDMRTAQSVDGMLDAGDDAGAHRIDDYALRKVLGAWAQHHRQTGEALVETLREALSCPITQELFSRPMIAADGRTYEAAAIAQWLQEHHTSPLTQAYMPAEALWPAEIIIALMTQYGMVQKDRPNAQGSDALAELAASVADMSGGGHLAREARAAEASASLHRACQLLGRSADAFNPQVHSVIKLCHSHNKFDRACGQLAAPAALSRLQALTDVVDTTALRCFLMLQAADLHRFVKHYRQATTMARRIVTLMPDNIEAMSRLALLMAMANQLEQAEQWLSVPGVKEHAPVYWFVARGELCRRQGQHGQALQCFADAQAASRRNAELLCPPELVGLQRQAFQQKAEVARLGLVGA